MRVYRLRHKQYKGDVVFGMPPTYCKKIGEKKINELFSNMKPWKHAIPYYKKSKFAFISADALVTFLFLDSIKQYNNEQKFMQISRKIKENIFNCYCSIFHILPTFLIFIFFKINTNTSYSTIYINFITSCSILSIIIHTISS